MKSKKGFTLVELIAVIVVLALVALITVPVVLNLITKARERALVNSGYGILDAVRYYYVGQYINKDEVEEVIVNFPEGHEEIKLEGKIPDSGNVMYTKEGKSSLAIWDNKLKRCAIKYEDDNVVYLSNEIKDKEKCSVNGIVEETVDMEYTWNGYIYYEPLFPLNAINKRYRIVDDENIIDSEEENWQEYTEPIWIKLEDINKVMIEYDLEDEHVIVPANGEFLIDIRPNTTETVRELLVTIIFDKDASEKKYRIDGNEWIDYEEPFIIKENCLIEAQGSKNIDVLDSNGDIVYTTKESGKAAYVIKNIDRSLKGPSIFVKEPINSNSVVSVDIEYPESAEKRYYKIDDGEYKEYVNTINIQKYGTKIYAYYTYDGDESDVSIKEVENELKAPVIEYKLEPNSNRIGYIKITYPSEATKKYYVIDDIKEYTKEVDITKTGTQIKAYYEDEFSNISKEAVYVVDNLKAPVISEVENKGEELKRIKISYPAYAKEKKYNINGVEKDYEGEISITVPNAVVYGYYIDSFNNESEYAEYIYGTVLETPKIIKIDVEGNEIDRIKVEVPVLTRALYTIEYKYALEKEWTESLSDEIAITKNKRIYVRYKIGEEVSKQKSYLTKYKVVAPVITNIGTTGNEVANIRIDSVEGLKVYYKIGTESEKEYNNETFKITTNKTKITAYAEDIHGNKSIVSTYLAKKIMSNPILTRIGALGSEVDRVEITYPTEAFKKYYSINGGDYKEYSGVIEITKYGTEVKAYYIDEYGNESNKKTLVVNGSIESPKVEIEYVKNPDGGAIGYLKVECGEDAQAYYKLPNEELKEYKEKVAVYKYNQRIQTKCVDVNGNYKNKYVTTKGALSAPDSKIIAKGSNAGYLKITPTITLTNVSKIMYKDSKSTSWKTYTAEVEMLKYGRIIETKYVDKNGNESEIKEVYTLDKIFAGPEIKANTKEYVPEVEITITGVPSDAKKTQYRINGGKWQLYTSVLKIKENSLIEARYYDSEGYISQITSYQVDNIKKGQLPSIYIEKTPKVENVNEVTITITSDSNDIEYSLDESYNKKYTGSFTLKTNTPIYARAKNIYGISYAKINVQNIKEDKPLGNEGPGGTGGSGGSGGSSGPEELEVNISDKRQNNIAIITITCEMSATCQYRLGEDGELLDYTEPFTVNKNTTIYAYSQKYDSEETLIGSGESKHMITYLSGLAYPVIKAEPENNEVASSVEITIEYDSNATIKQYSIDGGNYVDYTGTFKVTENSLIIAKASDEIDTVTSSYNITNIQKEVQELVIDKGGYLLVKLNYPSVAKVKEYNYEDNGWKVYNEQGILFIRESYKEKLLSSDVIKIKDETGLEIIYKGDYYIIANEEQLGKMQIRWDRKEGPAPEIILDTTEITTKVKVSIIYDKSYVKKQYRLLKKDGTLTDWMEYRQFDVYENNTVVYARGIDDSGLIGKEATYKITNIDDEGPTISLNKKEAEYTKELEVIVEAYDISKVTTIRYTKGKATKEEVEKGQIIENFEKLIITDNGEYTFYAVDDLGNYTVKVFTIDEIDKEAPICGNITGSNTKWTKEDVTVSVGCSDNNGCSKEEFTKTFTTSIKEGIILITDKAGNTNECPVDVYIDKESPIVGEIEIIGEKGENDWYTSDVTIKVNDGEDLLSGHSSTTVDVTSITNNTKGEKVTVTTKDKVGNISTKEYTIKVDKTVPTVSITKAVVNNQNVLTASVSPSTTESNYTYAWYKNGTLITSATSSSYTTSEAGTYKVVVKTGAGKSASAERTINSYTISYNLNGGTGNIPSQTKIEDLSINLTTVIPTKDGSQFLGWAEGSATSSTVYTKGAAYTKNQNVTFYAKWDEAKLCKRATTLHTEVCKKTSNYCATYGPGNGNTVTYGNKTTTSGVLKPGDAFDCDVNGDGKYDSTTERFYYVSRLYNTTSKSFDNNYAVLSYYTTTGKSHYAESIKDGPTTARSLLPTTSQWPNVKLSNTTRAILNELGGNTAYKGKTNLPTSFSYAGYAARLLTMQEASVGCGVTLGYKVQGQMKNCLYLYENTSFVATGYVSWVWLETVRSESNQAWNYIGQYIYTGGQAVSSGTYGVRPVIEVKLTDISY